LKRAREVLIPIRTYMKFSFHVPLIRNSFLQVELFQIVSFSIQEKLVLKRQKQRTKAILVCEVGFAKRSQSLFDQIHQR